MGEPRVLWTSDRKDFRIVATPKGDVQMERIVGDGPEYERMNTDTAERYLGTFAGLLLQERDAALADRDFERKRCAVLARTCDDYRAERDAALAERDALRRTEKMQDVDYLHVECERLEARAKEAEARAERAEAALDDAQTFAKFQKDKIDGLRERAERAEAFARWCVEHTDGPVYAKACALLAPEAPRPEEPLERAGTMFDKGITYEVWRRAQRPEER